MPLLVGTSSSGVRTWQQPRACSLSFARAGHPGRGPGQLRETRASPEQLPSGTEGECNVLMGGCDKRPSSPGLIVLSDEGLTDPGQFSVEWKNLNL